MFSMRALGVAIRNIGRVRGRPSFQAQKPNEFQAPISDAKRKLFSNLICQIILGMLFLTHLLENLVGESGNSIEISKEIEEI